MEAPTARGATMATELCQKCKQSHPGRVCDYDDKGDCAETTDISNDETSDGIRIVPAPARKSHDS